MPIPLETCLCGCQLGPGLLACPSCGRLLHADRLRQLAAEAEAAGETALAMQKWREALELLPSDSPQAGAIQEKLARSPAASAPPNALSQLGMVGVLLWKSKSLLVGLTKAGTFWSMLVSFGVYATVLGWPFAGLFILSIYVHEMGHVQELQRLGFRFEMPRFIPGLGAYVMLKDKWTNPAEDARIGLAGPWWGLAAALACYGASYLAYPQLFLAAAKVGAWINLFNLVPIVPLDGGRGVRPLSRTQLGALVLLALLLHHLTGEGLLALFILVAGLRWLGFKAEKPEGDGGAFQDFAILLAMLTWISQIQVSIPR